MATNRDISFSNDFLKAKNNLILRRGVLELYPTGTLYLWHKVQYVISEETWAVFAGLSTSQS